jgi:hypothetical protein
MPLREIPILMQKACPTRQYDAGVLEQWGTIGDIRKFLGLHNTPLLHYSTTPLHQVGRPYFLRLDIVVGINPIYLVRT